MLSEVLAFIERPDSGRFEELALLLFQFQYERNEAYRRFCDRRGREPGSVQSWSEIPAVPVSAFKNADLSVSKAAEGAVFLTSGTTEGMGRRGRHRVPELSIYRASALRHFEDLVLPDGARVRLLVLAPSLEEHPSSSLCQMIAWIEEAFGVGRAEHFVVGQTLDESRLAERLREVEPAREPVMLIGVTSAFLRFADVCRDNGSRFRLPYGSRIVDTGGTKGCSRNVSRVGLLRAYWETFGVPGYYVANEYGMTEMCSQFYDGSIRDHVEGRKRDRHKVGPSWVRTQIVSPETLSPVPRGTRGLLRHFDLANVGSVVAIQTEDLGVEVGEGFEILGRAEAADSRGCSLLVREVVS